MNANSTDLLTIMMMLLGTVLMKSVDEIRFCFEVK
jgi:hypothetical protein